MARYYFARCELDTDRHELKVADIVREIEPQVFDLLALLVERGDKVVSRDDLIEHIWQGRIVSDSAISVRINSARKAVGDNGTEQAIIKTVARRGFKLAVPVTQKQSVTSLPVPQRRRETPDTHDEKPVLVVFPFECIGAGAGSGYLSRGLADDIATELSRFHTIAVISTFSSFQHDSTKMDAHTFAASLGATHIVSGRLQKQGTGLRLTVRLGEVTTHTSIWSERYVFDEQELFEVQDDTLSNIVGSLFSRLHEHQMITARKKPAANLSAYNCLLRALDIYKAGDVSLEDSKRALYWFNRTLELDPYSARAMAWRICCLYDFQPNPPREEHNRYVMQNIQKALSIDPGDHEVHRIVGGLHLIYGNRELADYHLAKSAELNSNDARILLRIGFFRSFLGDRMNDLNYVERAFARNPLHPNFYWSDRGVVLFAHGRYEEALHCLQLGPDDVEQNNVYKAACYSALSDRTKAQSITKSLQQQNPEMSLSWLRIALPYRNYQKSDNLDHLAELLRAAGMPA